MMKELNEHEMFKQALKHRLYVKNMDNPIAFKELCELISDVESTTKQNIEILKQECFLNEEMQPWYQVQEDIGNMLNSDLVTDEMYSTFCDCFEIFTYGKERADKIMNKKIGGHWINICDKNLHDYRTCAKLCFQCSECKSQYTYSSNYCPNCGSKMVVQA